MVRYAIFVNGEKMQQGELLAGVHLVGRSHSANVRLAEPDISGKHLKLEVGATGVYAENLSSHGTSLRGEMLSGRTKLESGDILTLGKHTQLSIEIDQTAAPVDREMKTMIPGESPVVTNLPDNEKTEISQSAENEPQRALDKTSIADNSSSDSVLKTDVMHTRLASLEEMNILRHVDKKRSKGKLFKTILGAIGAILLLVVLYSLKASPKEANLTWPVDSAGQALGAFAELEGGGHGNNGFSLAYPNLKKKTTIKKQQDLVVVNTWCGRDGSVPLRISFIKRQNIDFLTMDRKAVFSNMLGEIQEKNHRWNIAQISEVFFVGSDNGVPCLSAGYRREMDGKSWYGDALFFRTGDCAFLRLAEVPAEEWVRAQEFISKTPFLKFSIPYVHGHWEGNMDYKFDGNTAVMMDEVLRHLSKQASFEWARTYLLLQNVLMESTKNKDTGRVADSLTQLRRLRAMQTIWYNAQKIQYETAKLSNNKRQENAVLELSKTVFSSPDDLRYVTLRRNQWD